MVATVFDYLDYRDFLKDFYEKKKSEFSLFSYRVMAQQVGMDASYLFRVLQKDLHLPARCVPRGICRVCATVNLRCSAPW